MLSVTVMAAIVTITIILVDKVMLLTPSWRNSSEKPDVGSVCIKRMLGPGLFNNK